MTGQNLFQMNPVAPAKTSTEDLVNALKSLPDLLKQIKDALA
jgi:hypothetical protein